MYVLSKFGTINMRILFTTKRPNPVNCYYFLIFKILQKFYHRSGNRHVLCRKTKKPFYSLRTITKDATFLLLYFTAIHRI